MDDAYCSCGVRFRQWFNDVASCPRCRTIVVRKDHVTMTWRGARAEVLLDEFERHITKVLLDCREEAETYTDGVARPHASVEQDKPTEVILKKDLIEDDDLRPCDNCGAQMKRGCAERCPNCKWISPCSTE